MLLNIIFQPMGSSLGLCFTVPALGGSEAGPPVAFLLALLLKGLAPLKAQGPPCMAVPGAQAAAAIGFRSSRFHHDTALQGTASAAGAPP